MSATAMSAQPALPEGQRSSLAVLTLARLVSSTATSARARCTR
ncbi:MAG: hypothetical protein U1F25_13475 [Rubrivivax sp.]